MINKEDAVVLDIRAQKEFKAGHILGARQIKPEALREKNFNTHKKKCFLIEPPIFKNKEYVTYPYIDHINSTWYILKCDKGIYTFMKTHNFKNFDILFKKKSKITIENVYYLNNVFVFFIQNKSKYYIELFNVCKNVLIKPTDTICSNNNHCYLNVLNIIEEKQEFNYSKATIESDTFSVTSGGTGITASITPALESDVSSYMVFGYKDFPSDSKFTPYAGLGLGVGNFSAKNQTATVAGTAYQFEGGDETVFSFGLKGGVSYEIADNTSLFTEGLYQNFASYQVAEAGYETVNYDSNQFFAVSAGIKFSF